MKSLWYFVIFIAFSISINAAEKMNSDQTAFRIMDSNEYLSKRIELIQTAPANSEILISQFIFRIDNVGKIIIKELIRARRRGVKVKIIIDGIGEAPILSYSKEDYVALNQLGFEVKIFHPKHYLNKLRNRMHHKIFIANNQVILGSSSIYELSQFYIEEMDMLFKGKVVGEAIKHFYEFWDSSEVEDRYTEILYTGSKKEAVEDFLQRLNTSDGDFGVNMETMLEDALAEKSSKEDLFTVTSKIKYVKDSPVKNHETGIDKDITNLVRSATKSVIIVTPYPYFSEEFKNTLKKLPRNVTVTLITSSQEAKSNENPGLQKSYEFQLPFFKKRKIEVLEFNRFLHAKIIIVDSKHIFLGSHNLDYLGFESNNENGVVITDYDKSPKFSKDFNERILSYIDHSTYLIKAGNQKKDINHCLGLKCNMWRLYYPQMTFEAE